MLRALQKNPRGAAAIEFALVLPILAAILLGVIDYGYYFFTQEVLTNAAREGARAGSIDTTGDHLGVASSVATAYAANTGLADCVVTPADQPGPAVRVSIACPATSLTGFTTSPPHQAMAEMRR